MQAAPPLACLIWCLDPEDQTPCHLGAHLEVLAAWHPFERGLPCLILSHHPGAHKHVKHFQLENLLTASKMLNSCHSLHAYILCKFWKSGPSAELCKGATIGSRLQHSST